MLKRNIQSPVLHFQEGLIHIVHFAFSWTAHFICFSNTIFYKRITKQTKAVFTDYRCDIASGQWRQHWAQWSSAALQLKSEKEMIPRAIVPRHLGFYVGCKQRSTTLFAFFKRYDRHFMNSNRQSTELMNCLNIPGAHKSTTLTQFSATFENVNTYQSFLVWKP